MNALVLTQYDNLEVLDRPEPVAGANDVIIRVAACGICGSDVHGVDGSTGRRQPPIVMGHEAAGVISKVGESVEDWSVGDRVTFDSTIYCGECAFCKRGQVNLCDDRRVLGVSCDEYMRDGAFAEYVVVPQHILYRVPDDLSFEYAAMTEPVAVALHAVSRLGDAPLRSAVVFGAGTIGLLIVQALRMRGCEHITTVDIDPRRLELAMRLGSHAVINSKNENVAEKLGNEIDASFEAVGITPTVNAAATCLRKGGALVLVGNVSPTVELPLQAVVSRELTLYGSCAINGEYDEALKAMASGAIELEPMISATAPLAEGAAWFTRLQAGDPDLLKVILHPSGSAQV